MYEPLKDKTTVMPKVFIRKIRVTTVEARLYCQYYEINYDSNKNNKLNGFNLEINQAVNRKKKSNSHTNVNQYFAFALEIYSIKKFWEE